MKPFLQLDEAGWLEIHGVFKTHDYCGSNRPEADPATTLLMCDSGLHVPTIEHGLAVLRELSADSDAMTGIWSRQRRAYVWQSPGARKIIDRFGSIPGSSTWAWKRFVEALPRESTNSLTAATGATVTCRTALVGNIVDEPDQIATECTLAIGGEEYKINLMRYVAINGARSRSRFDADNPKICALWLSLKTRGWPTHPLDWLADCGREVLELNLQATRGFERPVLTTDSPYLPFLADTCLRGLYGADIEDAWKVLKKSPVPMAAAKKLLAAKRLPCKCSSEYSYRSSLVTEARLLGFHGDLSLAAIPCACVLFYGVVELLANGREQLPAHVVSPGEADDHYHLHAFGSGSEQNELLPPATAIICASFEQAKAVAALSGNSSAMVLYGERDENRNRRYGYVQQRHTCFWQQPAGRAAWATLPGADPRRIVSELALLNNLSNASCFTTATTTGTVSDFRVTPRVMDGGEFSVDCVPEVRTEPEAEWTSLHEMILTKTNPASALRNHLYDGDLSVAEYERSYLAAGGVEATLWGELSRLRDRLMCATTGICNKNERGAMTPENSDLWGAHSATTGSRLGMLLRDAATAAPLPGHRPGCLGGHELLRQLLRSLERTDSRLSAGYTVAMLWIDHGCSCDCQSLALLSKRGVKQAESHPALDFGAGSN